MKTLQKLLVVGAVTTSALASTVVYSNPVFQPGLSNIELINRENIYRAAANCTPTTCLTFDPLNDPGGYQRPDPTVPNNVLPGDLFVGVLASRSITNVNTGTITWSANEATSPYDTFSGYFVQQVNSVALNVNGVTDRILLQAPTVADPFFAITGLAVGGVNGVIGALWVDSTTPPKYTAITVPGSITVATDGNSLWATFGIGAIPGGVTAALPGLDPSGYVYSETDLAPGLGNFTGNFYLAADVIPGGSYNAGTLLGINDPVEGLYGGQLPLDPATTRNNNLNGICIPNPAFACNTLVGNGQLSANQDANSPWTFASEDPLQLYSVPEPTSLALLGLGLMGIAGFVPALRGRKGR